MLRLLVSSHVFLVRYCFSASFDVTLVSLSLVLGLAVVAQILGVGIAGGAFVASVDLAFLLMFLCMVS